jgi:surface polysaccharide O-acyltransferase-like enzyme
MAKANRLLFIDILKIVAIILIVIDHVPEVNITNINLSIPVYGPFGIGWGYLGIALFIFASGIGLSLAPKSLNTLKEITSFYKTRLLRIYPAYWMAIIFTIALAGWPHYYTWWDLFTTFTGIQTLVGYWSGGVSVVFWFIGLIMFLYLLYPLFLWAINKQAEITLIISAFINIVSLAILLQYPSIFNQLPITPLNLSTMYAWFPLCWIFYMILGIYIAKKNLYPKIYNKNNIIMLMADLSFYVYLVHTPLEWSLHIADYNITFYVIATMAFAIMLYSFDMQIRKLDISKLDLPTLEKMAIGFAQKNVALLVVVEIVLVISIGGMVFVAKPIIDRTNTNTDVSNANLATSYFFEDLNNTTVAYSNLTAYSSFNNTSVGSYRVWLNGYENMTRNFSAYYKAFKFNSDSNQQYFNTSVHEKMNIDLSYYGNLVNESINQTKDYEAVYDNWYWNDTPPVRNG